MLVKVTSLGPKMQSQNRIDVNYEKNFWSGSLAYKTTLEKQCFIDSEPKGEVINLKIDLTNWRPFKLQNSNGLLVLVEKLSFFESAILIF